MVPAIDEALSSKSAGNTPKACTLWSAALTAFFRRREVILDQPRVITEPALRIETLDVLRGFALLGMILVHFHQRFQGSTPGVKQYPGEGFAGWIVWMGVEQKAMATFAFLFGVGFAIVMRRAETNGRPLVAFYLRRLAILGAIGVVLESLTTFTVLLHYAIWGVPLLLVRKWPTRALLALAVTAAAAGPLINLGTGIYESVAIRREGVATATPALTPATAPVSAEAQSYPEVVLERLSKIPRQNLRWQTLIPGFSFTLFLLGLLALRHGVFDDPRRHLRLIVTPMAIGLASWFMYWWLLPMMPTDFAPKSVVMPLRYGLGIVADQWLAFTYIGALVLLLAFRSAWTGRLAAFGIAGRMALTNYVLQALAIEYLSSRFGLDLNLRPFHYIVGAGLLFSVQVLLSYAWLARFRMGPLEWAWRSMTDLRWQRISGSAISAVPAHAMALVPFALLPLTVPVLLAVGVAPLSTGEVEPPPAANLGFESGDKWPWGFYGAASVVASGARSGRHAVSITNAESGVYQRVGGLEPNTSYTLRAHVRAGAPGTGGHLYAKKYGGEEVKSIDVSDRAYTPLVVVFITGATNTTAEIGVWRPAGTARGDFLVDDVELKAEVSVGHRLNSK